MEINRNRWKYVDKNRNKIEIDENSYFYFISILTFNQYSLILP
jgi:hypothetical protein